MGLIAECLIEFKALLSSKFASAVCKI